jgi:ATP/maltotriose-dependent transcriptional regulator MalT
VARYAGRFEDMRARIGRAVEEMDALGQRALKGATLQLFGQLELAADNPSGALEVLLAGDETLAEVGERSFRSTLQGYLAMAHAALGDSESAQAAIELSEALCAEEDVATLILIDLVRSRLALAAGDLEAAERWARSAVEYASRTDFVPSLIETKLDLGQVLLANGQTDEAQALLQEALRHSEAKGDQPYADRARELLASIKPKGPR